MLCQAVWNSGLLVYYPLPLRKRFSKKHPSQKNTHRTQGQFYIALGPRHFRDFRYFPAKNSCRPKKGLTTVRGAPGTVPYGKSGTDRAQNRKILAWKQVKMQKKLAFFAPKSDLKVKAL